MKLRVDDVTTSYLRNISFELENENIVILGSNGAGKTTLSKVIVGLEENSNVYYGEEKVSALSAARRCKAVNFIPSKLEVFDEYIDVEEFLQLSLFNGTGQSDMEAILKRLEIEHLKNSSCKTISSGESQLVLFASGLLHNAELTIFDEPTANLDSDKKIKVYETLRAHTGWKMVITHDLNLAYQLGYRILFLEHGELVYDGSCEAFFDKENLERLFGNSIKKVEEYFMVNYR
ncbi:ATP-binding cassette domain-containing protein [Sulfuricurvum sp.]|uniref:ATP-binding cassette domain-containing protein n=1 Tax=Sulfuricurvum sp. TaxID=2025608 RepID=UPI003BB171F5